MMMMRMHKSITVDRVHDACMEQMFGLEDPGFCVACGGDVEGVKPETCKRKCEHCGRKAVFGAQELLLTMVP
jgi:hypothetical protein